MDKKTETKAVKTNRYTILDAEIKALSKEKKAKKAEYLKACADALAAYRKYVKETYRPGKKAALEKFAASKVLKTKAAPKVEKKPAKKTVAKKPAKKVEPQIAAEVIAKGEAAIADAKAKAVA